MESNKHTAIAELEKLREGLTLAILKRDEEKMELEKRNRQIEDENKADQEKIRAFDISITALQNDEGNFDKVLKNVLDKMTITTHEDAVKNKRDFPKDQRARVLFVLKSENRLLRKIDIEDFIKDKVGNRKMNLRPIIRALISEGKIASFSFNGSLRFTYLGLPEMIEHLGGVYTLKQEYNLPIEQIPFVVTDIKIKIGKSKNELELA